MVEIYWLQRLGNLGFVFNTGFWFCVCVAFVIAVASFFLWIDDDDDEITIEYLKDRLSWINGFVMVFAFFLVGAIFTPTEKDLIAIYGIGGVVDYVKSNDKAKELPDNVVDALTRYVDSIEKENKDNN